MFFKYWWVFPVVYIVTAVAIAGTVVKSADKPAHQQSYEFVECKNNQEADYKCWKQHFEALVYNKSPQNALESAQTESDKQGYVRGNCHQIAHVIGRASAIKNDLNVAKTFEQGNQFCASGYYHGAMESVVAEVGSQKIKNTINNICAPFRQEGIYKLKHYDCVHGLGHGVMGMENYELFKAVEACELLDNRWELNSCTSGVFMENIMTVFNNPDYPSKYLKKGEPLYPCTAVAEAHKNSCYLNQTSYALTVTGYDYGKVFELCAQAGTTASTCYQSLGRDASGNSIQNPTQSNTICQLGTTYEQKSNCIIGAVKDIIWIGNSKTNGDIFCSLQQDASLKQICLSTSEEYYRTFQ